jgi:hypothetical protein
MSDPAASRAKRFLFRALNQLVDPVIRSGFGTPLPLGGGLVVVETTGRATRLPRRVPLVATRVGSRVIVSTVRADSQWVRNLESDASARVWLGGRARPARASVHRGPLNIVRLDLEEDSTARPSAA